MFPDLRLDHPHPRTILTTLSASVHADPYMSAIKDIVCEMQQYIATLHGKQIM